MGGIRLPQYDAVVKPGVSGQLAERGADQTSTAQAVANAYLELWRDIRADKYDPQIIHDQIAPFAVSAQLPRLFAVHRKLQHKKMSNSLGRSGPAEKVL